MGYFSTRHAKGRKIGDPVDEATYIPSKAFARTDTVGSSDLKIIPSSMRCNPNLSHAPEGRKITTSTFAAYSVVDRARKGRFPSSRYSNVGMVGKGPLREILIYV